MSSATNPLSFLIMQVAETYHCRGDWYQIEKQSQVINLPNNLCSHKMCTEIQVLDHVYFQVALCSQRFPLARVMNPYLFNDSD